MTIERKLEVQCGCGERVAVDAPWTVLLDEPATRARVARGDFLVGKCARCGKHSGVAAEMMAVSRAADLYFMLVPDDARVAAARKQITELAPTAKARIVASRSELAEKVRLLDAGIDDVAFEVVKQLAAAATGDREAQTAYWFREVRDGELHMDITHGGQPHAAYKCPLQVLKNVEAKFATAAHARELEVDARLARRLMFPPTP